MKITICGSIAFHNEMQTLKQKLESLGHEVLAPYLNSNEFVEISGDKTAYMGKYIEDNGGTDSFPGDHKLWDLKAQAIRDHYDKIEWCDAIVISNHEKRGLAGYIGGNTLMEMGVAFFLKKPIYVLNDVSSELSYKQEIYGMKPIMLKGDLTIIA